MDVPGPPTDGADRGETAPDPESLAESARVSLESLSDPESFAGVYATLRRMAQRALGDERANHSLQATALVHEAWLRIRGSVGQSEVRSDGDSADSESSHSAEDVSSADDSSADDAGQQQEGTEVAAGKHWNDRDHFLRVAAVAMRCILIDHARRRKSGKRIPVERMVPLDADAMLDEAVVSLDRRAGGQLIDLDDALTELAIQDRELAEFTQLRFFAGVTVTEAARLVGAREESGPTMWRAAKAWLRRRMKE